MSDGKRRFKVMYTTGTGSYGMMLVAAVDHVAARAIWQKYQTVDARCTEIIEDDFPQHDPLTGKEIKP